jgi:DNA-binding MarR family transcriptional regulator
MVLLMDPAPTLSRHVCFALYTASRAVTNRYRPLLDALGITYPQYLVLLVLWDKGDTTVKDLGAALQLESSTLSPLLKRLEVAGIVERRRRIDDERSVEVRLTERGADLHERARAIPGEVACATGLSIQELEALRATLQRVTATLSGDDSHASLVHS